MWRFARSESKHEPSRNVVSILYVGIVHQNERCVTPNADTLQSFSVLHHVDLSARTPPVAQASDSERLAWHKHYNLGCHSQQNHRHNSHSIHLFFSVRSEINGRSIANTNPKQAVCWTLRERKPASNWKSSSIGIFDGDWSGSNVTGGEGMLIRIDGAARVWGNAN